MIVNNCLMDDLMATVIGYAPPLSVDLTCMQLTGTAHASCIDLSTPLIPSAAVGFQASRQFCIEK